VLARLKSPNSTMDEYHRIGIARFIWTPSQHKRYGREPPHPKDWRGAGNCGPISDQDERVIVKIL
jgi:hypothetical protein